MWHVRSYLIFNMWKIQTEISDSVCNDLYSAMDALQWMGAVRMRAQTADKNITIIHTTPVHQLTSWEDKSCVFVRNKSIIKMFLNSNCCFCLKYKSIINNNVSSSEKNPSLSHIKIQPHICLELFWLVNAAWSVQISLLMQIRPLFHSRKRYCEL